MSAIVALASREPEPDSAGAEAAFLGAAMCQNAIVAELRTPLSPDDFAIAVHGRIWAAIEAAVERGEPATPPTLKKAFDSDPDLADLGGGGYLARLTANGEASLGVGPEGYAKQIVRLADQRRYIAALDRARAAALDPDQPLDTIELPGAGKSARNRFDAIPYGWRDPASIPPRPWIYGRWLLRGTAACVVAPGGVGKTTLIVGMALAMATGKPLLGKATWGGRKRVWLWNLEDDAEEIARSIQAAAIHFGIARGELDGWLFLSTALDGQGLCTATMRDGEFHLLAPVYAKITAELIRRGIDLLVVDPFVSSHEADENDNGKIDRIAKAWARVAKDAHCAVVLVHHASKAGSGEVTALSARGAVSLVSAARSTLVINRMDEAEADRLGISADDRPRYIRVQDDKHNRAPAEAADWYRLASVDLDNATEAMPSDSVAVAEPWKLPDPFEDVTVDDLRRVQARAVEIRWRENSQASGWFGQLVAEELGLDLAEKAGKAKANAIIRAWIKAGAFRVEEAPDAKREMRKFIVTGSPA